MRPDEDGGIDNAGQTVVQGLRNIVHFDLAFGPGKGGAFMADALRW